MNNFPGEQSILLVDTFLFFLCTARTLPFALKNGAEFSVLASSSVLKSQIFIVILGKSHSSSRSLPHLQNERDELDSFLGFIWCWHVMIRDSK